MKTNTIVHIGSDFQRVQFEQIAKANDLGRVIFVIENIFEYGEIQEQSGHQVIYVNSNELNLRRFKLRVEIDRLRECFKSVGVDEESSRLLVASINNICVNLLLLDYHISEVWKYEDGMLDYLPGLKRDKFWEVAAKYVLFGRYASYTRYDNRSNIIRRKFFINSSFGFDGSRGESIKVDVVEGLTGDNVLFLTQSLSEDNVLPLRDEISCYQNVLGGFKGDRVVLKPHPRSSSKKISLLKKLANEMGVEFFDGNSSAEDLLRQGEYNRVIGCYSNTIFYSDLLFRSSGESYLRMLSDKNRNLEYVYDQLKRLNTKIKWL